MNAKTAYFNNSKFGESDHTSAIVPLISKNKQTGELFFIGTAFYISSSGILMTVKHNLFDKKNNLFENLGVFHFLPNNNYILRPIRKMTYTDNYDIAYLLPDQILDKNNMSINSPSLVLTESTPEINEQLATYGYPNSRMDKVEVHFNAEFFLGNCVEYHSNGFVLLKNPCFQTSILIKSGTSGGPVFDKSGKVFAVCSTGFDLIPGEENISSVTPIKPSFNLILEDGSGNKMSILELIDKKIISFSE